MRKHHLVFESVHTVCTAFWKLQYSSDSRVNWIKHVCLIRIRNGNLSSDFCLSDGLSVLLSSILLETVQTFSCLKIDGERRSFPLIFFSFLFYFSTTVIVGRNRTNPEHKKETLTFRMPSPQAHIHSIFPLFHPPPSTTGVSPNFSRCIQGALKMGTLRTICISNNATG